MNETIFNITQQSQGLDKTAVINGFQKGYYAGINKVHGLIFFVLVTYFVQFLAYLILTSLESEKYDLNYIYSNIGNAFTLIRIGVLVAMFFRIAIFI